MSFSGNREDAERRGAEYVGKPASWNCTKGPWTPNEWDRYSAFRLEEREAGEKPPQ